MKAKLGTRTFAPFLALAILLLVSLACGGSTAPLSKIPSPDGRFTAKINTTDNGSTVYEVIENDTGKLVLTTYSQYPDTKNDVKAAQFSDDSRKFAVAYHYGHQGEYTWIGVWSTETGERLYSKIFNGFTTYLDDAFGN